ncbi:HAD family hydrolase [Stenotrophomonas maltophilia]|uniref:HAD family hydrolase n=1 Tax=Stenotrophomonas maltophilia TaxID=40324 RepID=UPI0024028ECA|nr:HAD family phosphatase [Stenotrophomonas maltophilia]
MSPYPFDAVLFDCDGVLVDSEPLVARVLSEMLSARGWLLTPAQAGEVFLGKSVAGLAGLIEERTGKPFTAEWLEEFRQQRNRALERDLTAIAGAPEAVRAIHAATGGRIACASGADLHKVELQLRKVGLFDAFEGHVFSGQDMPRSKPHPDVYLAAAASLGVEPQRCAVIEDTVTGAAAGVAAGAIVFGFSEGGPHHSTPEALRAAGVHRVFARMDELPALLAAHAADTVA